MTAPTLGLGALYWQYLGEDHIKDYWVGHMRRVLSDVKVSSPEIMFTYVSGLVEALIHDCIWIAMGSFLNYSLR